ncbi:MAG: ABC transporter permease [Nanoarchaeota archaeon]
MIADYFRIVFGNIRYRQRRSILTMIGIFIGIAAVVSLISLGQGMQDAINSQFASVGADKVMVQAKSGGFGPPGSTAAGKVTDKDLEIVRRVSGVDEVAGRLLKIVSVRFNDRQRVQYVTSLPDSQDAGLIIEANNYDPQEGRMIRPSDKGVVMVGSGLVDKTNFGKAVQVGSKLEVNGKDFKVIGILKALGDPARNKAVVMNQDDLRDLLGIKDEELSMIVARAAKFDDPAVVAARVKRALMRERHEKEGRETVQVQTSAQLIRSFNTILNIVQAVLVGIAAISLLVGGIGITNTMYTAVLDRTREIGIMKAVGARNMDIVMIFLLESGLLGVAGGAIGVILGFSLSSLVEYAAMYAFGSALIQASFPWQLIVGSFVFSFIVGVLSGIVPAFRASRLPPVEALRYE